MNRIRVSLFFVVFSLIPICSTGQDYTEKHRPQLHFSPSIQWMNDPNGLVYFEGEYHLFYQYYPEDTVWGPMHWGHAVSEDLVHWRHLPIALYPDDLGYIFSGSAVYDSENTSGLGVEGKAPLIAIFTHHHPKLKKGENEYQSIAYSLDRGRTWTKYAGNPVLGNPGISDFRDPDVFWHEESKSWILTLAAQDRVHFYRSPNLIDWTFASAFGEELGAHGGVWECPDLFEIPVEGEDDQSRWVLLVSINPGGPNGGSATQYFLGEFDGEKFQLDDEFESRVDSGKEGENAVWLDYGPDNYAGVTYDGIPESDGRRIFVGWMGNWHYAQKVPTAPWRSAMTIPRSLELRRVGDALQLASSPLGELDKIQDETIEYDAFTFEGSKKLAVESAKGLFDLNLEVALGRGSAESFGFEFSNAQGESLMVGFRRDGEIFFIDRGEAGENAFSERYTSRSEAPRIEEGNTISFRVVIDASSVELFADDGLTVMTSVFYPKEPFAQVGLFALGGNLAVESLEVNRLRSVWNTPSNKE